VLVLVRCPQRQPLGNEVTGRCRACRQFLASAEGFLWTFPEKVEGFSDKFRESEERK
jgi:hypothetical protein